MTITESKKLLREKLFIQRSNMDQSLKEENDREIRQHIIGLIQERNYKTIHCYLPMRGEVDLYPLIEDLLAKPGIQVVCPLTLPKRKLEHLVLNSLQELEDGVFGTKHPANAQVHDGTYDLIIVPGMAFDRSNNRLGYGGGYYDQFLVDHPNSYLLGVCYPFQVLDEIPIEEHDVQLDEVFCMGKPRRFD